VKSTSGNDGTYLYFLEGSLTNAIGAMYAKEGVFIQILKIALHSPFILYFFIIGHWKKDKFKLAISAL
jgi:hypothetical protein